jgi:hypothetical protein
MDEKVGRDAFWRRVVLKKVTVTGSTRLNLLTLLD